MEESKGLSASFQQQPPMASQGQTFSLSTSLYFGSNTFGEDDPFQFAKPPPTTQYNNSQIGADVNSQVGNFIPSLPAPPVATNQEPISMSTFSPVQDKQFFTNAAMPSTNMVPPISTVDPKGSSQQDETPLSLSSDINVASTNDIPSNDSEQVPSTNVPVSKDDKNLPGGEFSVLPASGNEQSTNVTDKPHLQHCSYSNPGSQPESFTHHSDVSSGPMSLPAYPSTMQQQYTTEGINNAGGTITGTFTNADLPLSSMLQPGAIAQPIVHSLVQDNKELLPNSNVLTNADISAGFGGVPSHSSSANLSSLCSTPVDVRTNAAFFESDQQPSGALPTTSASNLGPPTNADYTDVPNEQLQFRPPSNAGMTDQAVVTTTNLFQPSETGPVLQTNTEFSNRVMQPPSNISFSVGPPSQTDTDKISSTIIPPQVTSVSTNVVMSSQTVSNVNVLSTTLSAMVVSSSIPLTQPSTVKHQNAHTVKGEMKTASTAVVYSAQYGDTVEQQFLTSPVTQSPTSAFVEYSGSSSEKHDNQLHMSSGKQSVSSLLDCPDTSILASPYKIVLPSPKTVEEKQTSFPPQTITMPEDAKVSLSGQMTAVTTSASVHVAATPKTDPVRSTLPVTQATMTSTPKQKDTHDTLPSVAPPLLHQQEPQERYSGNNEQRDFKDTSSLPPPPPPSLTRQQEHEQSYHSHQYHHADYQSQYDYDYRHSRAPGHYMEDDRGYYPPSRPHSRIPYDYYHPHPHDDYYYYRGRPEYYQDYADDPYYYEDSRYYQDRDAYHGREQLRYRDYEQPRYHDSRHPIGYDSYSEYPRGREGHADRRMREPDSYRYHQHHYYGEKYYHGETSHYPKQRENVDRTDQSYVKQSHNQPLETTVAPPEASTIYGPRDHFEASQFYNEETLHAQPSYVDSEYSGQYPEQYPEQYPDQYPEQYPDQYPSQYPDQYPDQYHMEQHRYGDQVDTAYTNEETYYEQ